MSDNGAGLSEERIAYLDGLVRQAKRAAAAFSQYTQEDVDRIVKPMVIAGLEAGAVPGAPGDRRDQDRRAGRQSHQEHGGHRVCLQLRQGQAHGRRDPRRSGARASRTRRAHRRHPLADPDHEPNLDGALQVHHGDQDAECGNLQPASGGVALLRRGRADHVRDGGQDTARPKASSPVSSRTRCTTTTS